MRPYEHYLEAERLLNEPTSVRESETANLARAQVHATLAQIVEGGGERLTTSERARVMALVTRWDATLAEVLTDQPSALYSDRSAITLDSCLRELRAAIRDRA